MTYGSRSQRVTEYNGTTVINAYERYTLEIPDREVPEHKKNRCDGENEMKEDKTMFEGFSPETVDFLWGIRMNNNREWFAENKKNYVNYLY